MQEEGAQESVIPRLRAILRPNWYVMEMLGKWIYKCKRIHSFLRLTPTVSKPQLRPAQENHSTLSTLLAMAPKSILACLLLLLPLAFSAPSAAALNPSCAPGGNFDMSVWSLQLPTGSKGKPDVITSAKIQRCRGYQS